jgi:ABC-type phosphate transport system substrate-binding protein
MQIRRMASDFRTLLTASVIMALTLLAGCTAGASSGTQAGVPAAAAGIGGGDRSGPGTGHIPSRPAQATVSLSETGSTLLYPLFGDWASAYHHQFPNVSFTTAATGSGTGIAEASAGTADIGASDAFLSSGNLVANPGLLNIPLAIAAQQVNYNLPGLGPGVHVRLTLDPTAVRQTTAEILRAALDRVQAKQPFDAGQLLGCDMTERSLRFGLKRSYRVQAQLSLRPAAPDDAC